MRNGMIKDSAGNRFWYQNGILHREDGPAIEYVDGICYWFQNDQVHREDGPAIEYPKDTDQWFLNNVEYTEEEHNIEIRLRKWGLKVDA